MQNPAPSKMGKQHLRRIALYKNNRKVALSNSVHQIVIHLVILRL